MASKTKNVPAKPAAAKPAPAPVAPKATGPVAPVDGLFSPDDTADYYEGLDAGAYAIPFLAILQGLSPAVQRGTPGYIDGAVAGLIFNTVTKALSESIEVTVLRRTHTICKWTPREDGSGFLGEEEAHIDNLAEFTRIVPDDKNRRIVTVGKERIEWTEHRNFWVAQEVEDGSRQPALISMTKSNLGSARSWNTNIDIRSAKIPVVVNGVATMRPVLHSGVWRLTPLLKTKDGNNWYVWSVEFARLHSQKAALTEVREKVALTKVLTVNRALEQIAEPKEGGGEM